MVKNKLVLMISIEWTVGFDLSLTMGSAVNIPINGAGPVNNVAY